MDQRKYRIYEMKFYLNAEHYIVIDGRKGERHPHTWEFTLEFALPKNEFVEFGTVEQSIKKYLDTYQNGFLNEIAPFDTLMPTVENMTDYFAGEFQKLIEELGGILFTVKNSETPTRTYIVNVETEFREKRSSKIISEAIDQAIDELVKDDE